jgi:hypothetical protein
MLIYQRVSLTCHRRNNFDRMAGSQALQKRMVSVRSAGSAFPRLTASKAASQARALPRTGLNDVEFFLSSALDPLPTSADSPKLGRHHNVP